MQSCPLQLKLQRKAIISSFKQLWLLFQPQTLQKQLFWEGKEKEIFFTLPRCNISLILIKIFLAIKKWHFSILMQPSIHYFTEKGLIFDLATTYSLSHFFFLNTRKFYESILHQNFYWTSFYPFKLFYEEKKIFSNQNISIYFILSIGGYEIVRILCYKIMVKNRSVSCISFYLWYL